MPDPITTVVTVISEHPQAAAAVASIYGVAKPFLAKILGPGAEEIGEIGRDYIKGKRAKNIERTLADADKLLAEVGREPQEVSLSVAVPLLEAASLQDEPSLAEKWAALLANSADPAQKTHIQPGFVEVLRQLTPTDARVLELVATIEMQPKQLMAGYHAISHLNEKLVSVSRAELQIIAGNLTRLGLCLSAGQHEVHAQGQFARNPRHNAVGPGTDYIQVIPFGRAFLAAVTPPTS